MIVAVETSGWVAAYMHAKQIFSQNSLKKLSSEKPVSLEEMDIPRVEPHSILSLRLASTIVTRLLLDPNGDVPRPLSG